MALYNAENSPEQNLAILAENPYPGRLLVVGFAAGNAMMAYAVEGRSPGSRNRRLTQQDNVVSTEVADTSLPVGDPELTIYDAMRRVGDVHIVSNGNQTDTVARYLRTEKQVADALSVTEHEPDAPNYTPRITGFHHFYAPDGWPYFGLSVIGRDPSGGSVRKLYTDLSPEIILEEGADSVGYAVHTYQGDSDPLIAFDEPPFRIPVLSSAEEMAGMLWESLDPENRVSVVAQTIKFDTGALSMDFSIINRHL